MKPTPKRIRAVAAARLSVAEPRLELVDGDAGEPVEPQNPGAPTSGKSGSTAGARKPRKQKKTSSKKREPQPLGKELEELRQDLQASIESLREELRERLQDAGAAPATPWKSRLSRVWDALRRRLALYVPGSVKHSLGRVAAPTTVTIVHRSGLLDADEYRSRAQLTDPAVDPAWHYVTEGERLGITPSAAFNPVYYAERHPDVAAAGVCLLAHYDQHGRHEGRRPRPAIMEQPAEPSRFSRKKKTILLVSHEASRTGAPILALNVAKRLSAKYNLITILLRGGDLRDDFEVASSRLICLEDRDRSQIEYRWMFKVLQDERDIRYAIVNSIASWDILPSLAEALVPTVTLVHEFSAYMRPFGAFREALGATTEPVFSTEVAADSFRHDHQALLERRVHILPQGYCPHVSTTDLEEQREERSRLKEAMRPEGSEDAFVVLGAGFVHIRKGVDLFIATAAAARRLGGKRRLRFVWIGQGYRPDEELNYSVYLAEQIARSGLEDHVVMLDEVTDLEPAYKMTDAFYLSSRLDPLPNVTIDAAVRGLPVICFKGATGIAEVLERDPASAITVVPHLDVDAAARRIVELADNGDVLKRVGEATRRMASDAFDMDHYVREIDRIGSLAVAAMRQRAADFKTLVEGTQFDAAIASPPNSKSTREQAISRYLTYWYAALNAPHQVDYLDIRRPCPGFNPQIYAYHHKELAESRTNPFADFIRKGEPEGPWLHRVIRSDDPRPKQKGHKRLRTAIQAHFHYPDLIGDFLAKLAANESRCDLLLSTDEEEKAEALRKHASHFTRGRVEIRVVPNRGRDIGPLLTEYGKQLLSDYDVVGHFHGKRSRDIDQGLGDRWREFLWRHLLGKSPRMVDLALSSLAADERLGLVFAEEPHLTDWSGNLKLAEQLAERAGIDRPLPPFFEYPVGTMFWARSEALAPLIKLKLGWTDYPEEPLPKDGTILHALERLLPFAARKQGFLFATLHISGVSW